MFRRIPSRAASSLPRFALLLAIAVALATSLPALAARDAISVIYDGEYGGYVPVVRGIERPDLAVRDGSGRVPEAPRIALRRAKRGLKHERRAGREGIAPAPPPTVAEGTRRWTRRAAIATQLWVFDSEGLPVLGARVYRYTDPSFYAVNDDDSGSRLFGHYRFLPFPYPSESALTDAALHDELWQDLDFAPVAARGPDIDQRVNSFVRDLTGPAAPPLEFVGRTDRRGALGSESGIFNLFDEEKFPLAVAPAAIRIGYIVVADGYLPQVSERRFTKGGVSEERTVLLRGAPDRAVVRSPEWAAALAELERLPLDGPDAAPAADAAIDRTLASLEPALARVDEEQRAAARGEAEARLVAHLYRRASSGLHELLAGRAVAIAPPTAARLYRFASLRAAQAASSEPARQDALAATRAAIAASPAFLPAYQLADDLLLLERAPLHERMQLAQRALEIHPFDRRARARSASLLLEQRKDVEAFDHLRYTYASAAGLGGDRELAKKLADYYWRMGLPEKAGAYLWMLTGRVPEDPFARVE